MTKYLNVEKAMESLSEKELAKAQEQSEEAIRAVVSGEKDLQQALGLEMSVIEGLYGEAYHLYNGGKYGKARLIFAFLTLFKPKDARFELALGACHQQQGNFADAILHYGKVADLAPESPLPYFYIYECYMRLELRDWAQLALEMLVARAESTGRHPKMLERGKVLLDAHLAIFGDYRSKKEEEKALSQPAQSAKQGATGDNARKE